MKQIISIFIALIFTAAEAREIFLQNASPAMLEKINRIDRIVSGTFKLKKSGRSAKKLTIVWKKISAPEMQLRSDTLYLYLPEKKDCIKDPESFQALVSALVLSSRCRSLKKGPEKAVSYWICSGIRHKLHAYHHAERFLHGIHHLPAAEAMYTAGKFPSPAKIPELPADLPPECISWHMEFSRFLLEAAADMKLLSSYAEQLLSTENYAKVNQTFEKDIILLPNHSDHSDNKAAEKIFWNVYNPEPAERKLQHFKRMISFQMPELDKEGNPTEKTVSCTIYQLSKYLAGRPDSKEQRLNAARQIRDYSAGCTYQEAMDLQKLAYEVYNTYRYSQELSEKLSRTADAVQQKLKRRKQIEDYLFNIETRMVSSGKTLSTVLNTVVKDRAVSPEQQRFLLEIEKIYSE